MMLRADLPARSAVRSDEELVDAAQDDGDTDEGEKPWESGGHGLRNEQPAGLLKSPKQPSAQDIAMHNLTHFPYRDWCPHCVASRRPNTPHRSRALEERKIPLVVADYCYLRDSKDRDLATCLVVGVYPYRMTMATVVDMKGRDENTIRRVSKFFKMFKFVKLLKGMRCVVYCFRKCTKLPERKMPPKGALAGWLSQLDLHNVN